MAKYTDVYTKCNGRILAVLHLIADFETIFKTVTYINLTSHYRMLLTILINLDKHIMAIKQTSTSADLAEMLVKTGQGDRQAFALLYQATSAKLFGLALRILASRDLAEEALQDAFIKIWHSADTYRADRSAVMTWMTAIVRNRCLDLLRAMPKEQSLNEDESFDDWASDDLGPMENAAANSDTKALMQCMKQLAPLQRQAFALSYFQGLAHEQLAKQLAQPLGTIKTWLRRGLETLKNCMGASGIRE